MTFYISARQFYALRLAVGVISVLSLAAVHWLPERRLPILPASHVTADIYADYLSGGDSQVVWLDKSQLRFECDFQPKADFPYCGTSIKFFELEPKEMVVTRSENYDYEWMRAIDLSAFDTLKLDIDYSGNASGLRLFLRNACDMPENIEAHNAQKFMYQSLAKRELGKPIFIPLAELKVADWWIDQYHIERADAGMAVDCVFEIGIDFSGQPPMGKHVVTIHDISATGQWVKPATVYFVLLVIWLVTLCLEGGYRVYEMVMRQRAFDQALTILKDENSNLRRSARTDALTGIYNRLGLESLLSTVFPIQGNGRMTLVLIEFDAFKTFIEQYGYAKGDMLLQCMAKAVAEQLRARDIFGRWGGEVFLLATPATGIELVQTLHRLIAAVESADCEGQAFTVSMGTFEAQRGDDFRNAFSEAEKALFNAKQAGGNTWRKEG